MGERTIENISVSVRIRPLNQRELTSGGEKIWEKVGESEIKEKAGARSFAYDRVYSENTETGEIFEYQGVQVIEKCIAGFNGCIFCYGQTGSGKTHTMHGIRKTNPGLVPLSIDHIFSMIQRSSGKEFLIRCAYIEIYNESINDLLNPNLLNLQLAEDKRSGIKIVGVTEEVCTSSHQVNSLLAMGEKHRITASTNFNQRSSRSHSIFRVIVESKNTSGKSDVAIAALNLIDLAGSESADVHGPSASSARSKEMKYINRSLLTLGTVIMRLSDKKNSAPIPYRDSKLTRLLQPALEGDSKVSIVCNISSCNDAYDETLSTLKFAQRAKKIQQVIVKNEVTGSKALIVKYEKEISELQERLREMEMKMVQEEKTAMNMNLSKEMLMLQEEKERADARLDSILQEKLQLKQELERLKSFIISAENVKPKPIEKDDKSRKDSIHKHSAAHSRTILSSEFRPEDTEPLLTKNLDFMQNRFSRMIDLNNEDSSNFSLLERNDTYLLNGIDNVENELLRMGTQKESAPTTQINPVETKVPATYEECLKIIEEQRRMIDSQKNMLDQFKYENEAKDLALLKFSKDIEEKQDQIDLLNDELTLCRNNLTKLQVANRFRQSVKK
ncbi:hypothetical protein SteCoe_34172 [Stentor coeruleus]|uniref:Kinesin motor domain-containing protein n=1 Tax=Stentor coeruleus TaxID=5963 RepID=A0A1R2AVB3_9CILI|nr:hypothetical protein SteCoe_34172 [Stentor coeruleus]